MEKQKRIVQMFNDIASSYDKANKILSFGIDISTLFIAQKIVND